MSVTTLTRAKVTLQYVRDPIAIDSIDMARIVGELEEGCCDPDLAMLDWLARQPVTIYDHVVLATDPSTGRCLGFLGIEDGATDRDETFFFIRAAFLADTVRGRGLIRKMMAVLMLRAIGNEAAPDAIVMRTSRVQSFRTMRNVADRMPKGATFYPAPPGEPTNLRTADLARRVACKVGHGIRFSTGTGAFRGGLSALGGNLAQMVAPEHRIGILLGADYELPDQVLVIIDFRGSDEEGLTESMRSMYRRP